MGQHHLLLLQHQQHQQQLRAGGVSFLQKQPQDESLSAVDVHLLMGRLQRMEEQESALRWANLTPACVH
jgi:hypothetical protein